MPYFSGLFAWIESLFRDARFGLRVLRKDKLLSSAAILSLSLAIGACIAAFSLIDALILRPLPLPAPDRLISLSYPGQRPGPDGRAEGDRFSYPMLQRFRIAASQDAELFGLTVWGTLQPATVEGGGQPTAPERLRTQWISGDGLSILGVHPAVGRLLTEADDQLDASRAQAVISYAYWMRRFGGNRGAVGRSITVAGSAYQIAGVAQADFSGVEPGYQVDIWLPITTAAPLRDLLNWSNDHFVVFGRLKPEAGAEQLRQVLQPTFTIARQEMVVNEAPSDSVRRFVRARLNVNSAKGGHETFVRWQFEKPLWILTVVVGLVLLIACSNVANLLVARGASRRREMVMRAALGASRGQLIQQVLMESCLLAAIACGFGVLIASWIAPALVDLMGTTSDPTYLDVRPDLRVLAFVTAIGLLTTFLFGLAPALSASGAHAGEAIREGGGRSSGGMGILRPVLAAQVGFSFMVLFVAALLLTSFQRLTSVDLGFSEKNLLVFTMEQERSGPGRPSGASAKSMVLESQLLDRLRHVPGVQSAATSNFALMGGAYAPLVSPPVRLHGSAPERVRPLFLSVSPDFFATMQIPLLAGREFTLSDVEPARPTAAVVNQAFAREFFPGQTALGKRFERMIDDDGNYAWQEIVGVVKDAKYNNLREATAPTVYQPSADPHGAIEVRTAGNPLGMSPRLRQEIQSVDPSLGVAEVTLQSRRIDETILQEHMLALLGGFFGLIAIVLAGVGLYGVLTYSVLRRTKEIGIRVALGAPLAMIVKMVTRDVAVAVGAGVFAGIIGGFALARLVTSLLFEVKPSDFGSIALPLILLLLAVALAAIPPALRIGRVDPADALAYE